MNLFLKKLTFVTILLSLIGSAFGSNTTILMDADNQYELPRKFRTTKDIKGLHLMASAQFSEQNLKYILSHYAKPAYIFDFRQESHGFVNGLAISWYKKNNESNLGRNELQIQKLENGLLTKLLDKNKIVLYRIKPNKDPFIIKAISVVNEQQLATQYNITYFRFPVTDHRRPDDKQVDRFIEVVKKIPTEDWLYFHCRGGKGRTTSFLAMVDIMRNAKSESLETILTRHYELGGQDLLLKGPPKKFHDYAVARLQFLKDFYDFCQQNTDGFETSWSKWQSIRKQ